MLTFKQFIAEANESKKTLNPPLFKDGKPNLCFENARKEYWRLKNSGESPEYHIGHVSGKSDEPFTKSNGERVNRERQYHPFMHAWVENKGKIHDPTPIKYGEGNYRDLPERPAHEHWKEHNYDSSGTVPEDKLHKELETFPSNKN